MTDKAFEVCIHKELTLRGVRWGQDGEGVETLALHGWLDNALTYTHLAPRLSAGLYALDMPGHGKSGYRGMPGPYNDLDQIAVLDSALDELKLPKVNLIGHSLGAIQAFLYALACPERVNKLVLLDACAPRPLTEKGPVEGLRSAVSRWRQLKHRKKQSVVSAERLERVRRYNLSPEAANLLLQRGIQQNSQKRWEWSADRLLYGPPLYRYTLEQIRFMLSQLSVPVQVIVANQGPWKAWVLDCAQHLPAAIVHTVEAGHYLHLEKESCGEVAELVETFLTGETT